MSFPARYRGVCASCLEPVVPGDEVRYNGDDELVHETCGSTPGRREAPVCPTCWLAHPGECP